MTFEEWFVEYGQFLWDADDPEGTTLKIWQAATAARDEDWKAVVGATLGDVANIREQATAAERDAVVALLKQWDYSRLAQHIESGVHITEPTAQAGYRKRSIALVDTVELAPEANDE